MAHEIVIADLPVHIITEIGEVKREITIEEVRIERIDGIITELYSRSTHS